MLAAASLSCRLSQSGGEAPFLFVTGDSFSNACNGLQTNVCSGGLQKLPSQSPLLTNDVSLFNTKDVNLSWSLTCIPRHYFISSIPAHFPTVTKWWIIPHLNCQSVPPQCCSGTQSTILINSSRELKSFIMHLEICWWYFGRSVATRNTTDTHRWFALSPAPLLSSAFTCALL